MLAGTPVLLTAYSPAFSPDWVRRIGSTVVEGETPITSIDELEAFLAANTISIDQFEAKLVTLGYTIDTLESMINAGTLTEEEILNA